MPVTRRDFLNGMTLAIAAGMTPSALLRAQANITAADYYPPALTGLRGNHPGSFDIAHEMEWAKKSFSLDHLDASETYDLVVVGGGISGLASAWFYRERHPQAKILIIENHDDFGGHAKRNEFYAGNRLILGYGGSESLQSPKPLYSKQARYLLAKLGVDIRKFETAFNASFYPDMGLSRGVFFDAETYGDNRIVAGDPGAMVADDIPPAKRNGRPWADFIADFPLNDTDRQTLIALHVQPQDYLPGLSQSEKVNYLASTSYADFLRKNVGLSEQACRYFQGRSLDFSALPAESIPAMDAYAVGMPGFEAMGLPPVDSDVQAEMTEPYIYHFPDGNASIARLLVRDLIPAVAPAGAGMESIVLAPFDYSQLDRSDAKVRLRLNSTAVSARNTAHGVEIGYIQNGKLQKIHARHAVLACYNMMIPYLCPGLATAQAQALSQNVKFPLVYTKVIVRNWQPWVQAGVHEIYAPSQPYSRVKLDYPVSLGGYEHPRNPDEPIGLHMVHVPVAPTAGLDARTQSRVNRAILYNQSFDMLEDSLRTQLQRMFGKLGFDHQQDILAITVNRWAHGYAYYANTLYDDEQDSEQTAQLARQPIGRIAIANSDAGWSAYMHSAIDEAYRAVGELSSRV